MSCDAVEVFGPLSTAKGAPTLVSLAGGPHGGVNILGSSPGITTGLLSNTFFLFSQLTPIFATSIPNELMSVLDRY